LFAGECEIDQLFRIFPTWSRIFVDCCRSSTDLILNISFSIVLCVRIHSCQRIQVHPHRQTWLGFSTKPDHKKTFPQWKSQNIAQLLANLSPIELQLTMYMFNYDPDRSMTTRSVLDSIYFQSMSYQLIIPPTIHSNNHKKVTNNATISLTKITDNQRCVIFDCIIQFLEFVR
jgi:hypothetical protein